MKKWTLVLGLFFLSSAAYGQGLPPFGALEPGQVDTLNLQNLNEFVSLPITSGTGRGLNLDFAVTYNSNIWFNAANKWTPPSSWGWNTNNMFGQVSYSSSTIRQCSVVVNGVLTWYYSTHYMLFGYTEPNGTSHSFPSIGYTYIPSQCTGSGYSGTFSANAGDSSGYLLDGDIRTNMPVTNASGVLLTGNIKDSNGNFISHTVPQSGEQDWSDSAGRTALKIITGTSTIQYQYQDTTGTYQTITLNLQSFNIKTNFACSGIVEYSGTASLPVSIVYPNGLQYSLSYEATPGNTGYTTGRVSQITLPNGGYIQYLYGSTNDGMSCSPAAVNSLTRIVNDGTNSYTWQFGKAPSGSNSVTTETYPQMPYDSAANQTVYTFNPNQEISRKIYQGSAASGTLLRTINTTWASNETPATTTTILEDNSTQSEIETTYDNYGNLQVLKEHDFGSGSPGSVLRTTNYTYLSTSAYTNLNIVNRVIEKTISDSTGTVKYREDTAYDGTTISPCPTGIPQHDDTNYPCTFTTRGNPTSFTTYTNASVPSGAETKNTYYDFFGNRVKADDDCCQSLAWNFSATTQYSSPDSVVKGPSGGTQLTSTFTSNAYTGQIASITDPNTQKTSFAYDTMRRVLTLTRPDNAQIAHTYNDSAHTETISNPVDSTHSNNLTQYQDGLGNSVKGSIADASSNVYSISQHTNDPLQRPYQQSDPYTTSAQYWTTTQYDALGRITKVILQDNSPITYNYSLATITITDPAGHQRKVQSDGLGRLLTLFEPDPANGNSLTLQTSYTYSVLDNALTIVQGSQTRSFVYDGMGRLTSETLPESGTTGYQYNTFDKLSQRTDNRGVITTYTYDTLNRLYQVTYNVGTTGVPATPQVTYSYGTTPSQFNNGRVLTMADGSGSTTYSYDLLGRLTQRTQVIAGTSYPVGYAYNEAGNVTSLTYPSTRVVQPAYDAVGRLISVANGSTNYLSGMSYNSDFQPTGLTFGNGVTVNLGYSADRFQLHSLAYSNSGTTLFSQTYSYNPSGTNNSEMTGITDNVDSGRNMTYTYDALNRLSAAASQGSANYSQWGLSWTYDRYGNRLSQSVTAGTAPSNSVSVNAATNHISTSGYAYDANGNMTNDGQNTITYDAENRIVSAATSSGTASYTYNGLGLRVQKAIGGTTTEYIFDKNNSIAEYANGTLTEEYINLKDSLVAEYSSGTLIYHARDNLSDRLNLDASANVLGTQGHYPYGESWYATNTTSAWHFTNYERDTESGNDNAKFRYNVNRLGRFLTTDSVQPSSANPQGLNQYTYVMNDPINHRDPKGRESTCDWENIPYDIWQEIWGPIDEDVWNNCDGGGGGGGGGDCGGGDQPSCNNPEPVPPIPPPSSPDCDCVLRTHSVKFTEGLAKHSFWDISDSSGQEYILTAGPEFKGPFPPYGTLEATAWNGSAFGPNKHSDPPYLPYDFDPAPCYNADLLRDLALNFVGYQNGTIPYHIRGPNSNSFAHALGDEGGLPVNLGGPPRAVGWSFPLYIVVTYQP